MSARVCLRRALPADVPKLDQLIATSARELGRGYYTEAETEAAIAHVFGVDSGLIDDGSYIVAELDGVLAGCGGWSSRRTLFGGDQFAKRDDDRLDPAVDAARIRAFFVAPAFARQGVGATILGTCEAAAKAAGFRSSALMATLPGVPFYTRHGYAAGSAIEHPCGELSVIFLPMSKDLLQ